jgi:hypothetical protein
MFRSSTKGGKNEKTHRVLARIEDDDLRIFRQEFQPSPVATRTAAFSPGGEIKKHSPQVRPKSEVKRGYR